MKVILSGSMSVTKRDVITQAAESVGVEVVELDTTTDTCRTFALAKAFVMMNRHLMRASTDPEAFAAEYVAFVRYAGNMAAAPNDPKSLYIRVQVLLVDLTPENVAAAAQEVESMPVNFKVMFWTEAIKQDFASEWASKAFLVKGE